MVCDLDDRSGPQGFKKAKASTPLISQNSVNLDVIGSGVLACLMSL